VARINETVLSIRVNKASKPARPSFVAGHETPQESSEHLIVGALQLLACDPLDCGAPGEYVLAHGGHSTRPGRGRRARRCRPRRWFQPP